MFAPNESIPVMTADNGLSTASAISQPLKSMNRTEPGHPFSASTHLKNTHLNRPKAVIQKYRLITGDTQRYTESSTKMQLFVGHYKENCPGISLSTPTTHAIFVHTSICFSVGKGEMLL